MCRGDVVVVWLHGRHVWLLLASQLGTKKGGAHRDNITKNDERHRRRSSFGSHLAHGDVAPGPLANMEQKGMGGEYSPGTTNDD